MSKNILVTGGAGLIGAQVVEDLNSEGISNIIISDHLGTSEKWKNLRRNFYLDYIEKQALRERISKDHSYFDQFSHIIHLGACSSTTEKDASYLIENNYHFTKDLAHLAVHKKIPFVYASSAATYGEGEFGYDDRSPIQELKPLNMYGYSKHLFDLYAEKTGLKEYITGLKYFNVFGFGEAHKGDMRSLVLKGYEQIKTTGKLKLFKSYKSEYADGEQKRDFLYAKDASRITLYLLFHQKKGIFNVGRGQAESWNQLAEALFQAMKKPVNIEYVEMPESLRGKYQYYTCANIHKLQESGYAKGFTSLGSAISEYVTLLESSSD
ncbi:nucleoside-diphosphate sugar epimerase [Leptospira ryugenii]|uniref:Nucleoside-diphosphate sugar epimerase n=1 Tax=Leptospira ryugenii TaxID=1917863 RepID=A0A2P2DW56_9LEPT|nr:ADP-glyceromanno-heptose 6-epimerase [Leptospira ryugenii]GBF48869.1 nucleoside-diphosphate sugar epimerase [Leptospira ryugenii]